LLGLSRSASGQRSVCEVISRPLTDLTDAGGGVASEYGYDVFGELRGQSGLPDDVMLFTGEQYDARARHNAPGLYYLRARYYDPTIGRFLSQDPVPSANLYAYVGNNPANLVDPYGLWPCPLDPTKCTNPVECAINGFDCVREPIDDAISCILDPFECTYERRSPVTRRLEQTLRTSVRISGGDFIDKEGGITLIINCRGLCELVQAPAFTVGHTIFTTEPTIFEQTLAHEKRHVRQYEILGDMFWVIWGGSGLTSQALCGTGIVNIDRCVHDSNILEILAGR